MIVEQGSVTEDRDLRSECCGSGSSLNVGRKRIGTRSIFEPRLRFNYVWVHVESPAMNHVEC